MDDYRIYKYPVKITDTQSVEIAGLVKVLSTGLDPSGQLCIWAIVNLNALGNKTYARVVIIGTGNPTNPTMFDGDEDRAINRFLGTVTMGIFVWHVFVSP